VPEKNFMDATYEFPIQVDAGPNGKNKINFYVDRNYFASLEEEKSDKGRRAARPQGNATVRLQKQFSYEMLAQSVEQLNEDLRRFHQSSPAPDESRIPEDVKPFLY
jgi:hypothetical protein